MPELRIEGLCCVNPAFTIPASTHSGTARVTGRERSCRCKDPSLQCREEILPHRYICRANMDSPPDAVSRAQGFRTDNLLLPPSSEERQLAEVKMRPPAEV